MKCLLVTIISFAAVQSLYALTLSEILSNPTGTDDGREWIEVYNEGSDTVDLATLTISIKGGTPLSITPVQGGTSLPSHGYAIISSTVSSQTKFLQDYPSYTGQLLRSSMSLVNTGVTSIDVRLGGVVVDSLSSYTAAKEGSSLSKINGAWVTVTPSPGSENTNQEETTTQTSQTTSNQTNSTSNQTTLTQMSPPTADVVLYVPFERTLVAGADTLFTVSAQTKSGRSLENMTYSWAFGDGGRSNGSSTYYRYVYPGHYIAQVEGTNGSVLGVATTHIHVVDPELSIVAFEDGKYGSYVDILNPNTYELDISQWKLSINGGMYTFPMNTRIGGGRTTRFSGLAMGFASTTKKDVTSIAILFPTNEVITRFVATSSSPVVTRPLLQQGRGIIYQNRLPLVRATTTNVTKQATSGSIQKSTTRKDTKIATFLRSFIGH